MKGGKSKVGSKEAISKLSVKKGTTTKKSKPTKDPNKPKRPPSAFFVFMEEFRVQYKQRHPNNKSVAIVGKAGGEKWKSLSNNEKAPYIQKADKKKLEYENNMNSYNKSLAEGNKYKDDEEEYEKTRSEVNDEDDDDDGSDQDEDDD